MLGESLLQLRRAAPQAAFTALVLSVTLFCLGLFAAGLHVTDRALSLLRDDLRVVAYLEEGTDRVQADAMTLAMRSWPGVRASLFRDRDEAERRFRDLMGPETADLFKFTGGNPLPESILLTVASSADAAAVAARIRKEFSVQVAEVCHSTDAYERLASLLSIARRAGAALVALLLLVGVGAVVMSVALGIDARREEIEIMRLVGATRGFIGAPYVVSSCIVGTIGAFVAAAALALLKAALAGYLGARLPAAIPLLAGLPEGRIAAGILAAGVAVAAGGSLFGLARRLRA